MGPRLCSRYSAQLLGAFWNGGVPVPHIAPCSALAGDGEMLRGTVGSRRGVGACWRHAARGMGTGTLQRPAELCDK